MFLSRGLAGILIVVVGASLVSASAATQARKPKAPRIVSAVMQDADRDARADSMRVTYSTRIRHTRDRDGRYPFAVVGYRIRSVGTARRKALVVALVEKHNPDARARPVIRYRRTSSKPVTGPKRIQAVRQTFRLTRPHRNPPPETPPVTPPPPAQPPPPAGPGDGDGDGTLDAQDCAPKDPAIHPKAADLPDLAFVDSNCDGIDGTENDAIFASPTGDDANPGTKEKPKRQIQAAVAAAAGKSRYVLAAAGSYTHVTAASGVAVYGGYDPAGWSRRADLVGTILGSPEGLFADGAKDVTLQLLTVFGVASGASAYGIRAIDGSSLRLERVHVSAGDGAPGATGANGQAGRKGGNGADGMKGSCDAKGTAVGGAGGVSAVGRDGGKGGNGHYESRGDDGAMGVAGTPAGKGGAAGSQGGFGGDGGNGSNGEAGATSSGGKSSTTLASETWLGQSGIDGIYGAPGNGGGGGGASGGQTGAFVVNGTGNAGSGGGGGGEGGRGGAGGRAGGGSFGVYLHRSALVAAAGSITAGNGGGGGRGGNGGPAGAGGGGGVGITHCGGELGRSGYGGRGGNGGPGGAGGGGAGGPSIGVMKVGPSSAVLTETAVIVGAAGPGGAPGAGGSGSVAPSQAGIVQAIYP